MPISDRVPWRSVGGSVGEERASEFVGVASAEVTPQFSEDEETVLMALPFSDDGHGLL